MPPKKQGPGAPASDVGLAWVREEGTQIDAPPPPRTALPASAMGAFALAGLLVCGGCGEPSRNADRPVEAPRPPGTRRTPPTGRGSARRGLMSAMDRDYRILVRKIAAGKMDGGEPLARNLRERAVEVGAKAPRQLGYERLLQFRALAEVLERGASRLFKAVRYRDLDESRAAARAVTGACNSCHAAYRD